MRSERRARNGAGLLVATTCLGVATTLAVLAQGSQYAYDRPGDRRFVNNTAVLERASAAGNNQSEKIAVPRARLNATFTRQAVVVDGVRDAAWNAAVDCCAVQALAFADGSVYAGGSFHGIGGLSRQGLAKRVRLP